MSRHDDHSLTTDLLHRLERDYGLKPKGSGKWMTGGTCPSCKKKELFAPAEKPRVVKCGRANKCGEEWHVKELYPELFENWGDRYVKTPEAPNAAADAYLRDARGFDLTRIAGWYVQESYYDAVKKIGSATVRFALAGDAWWERIIDQPQRFDNRKATFKGSYAGTWWAPPSLTGIPEELWLVEGIFDSIALDHHDISAVSTMSCNNYPATALAALAERCKANNVPRPKLVWAFDDGRAGRRYSKLFVERSRKDGWDACAAMIPFKGKDKLDWNDAHQRDRLTPKDIEEYRYQGDLLLAASAQEKAVLMYRRRGWGSFDFEFDSRLHWFKIDHEKFAKTKEALLKAHPEMSEDDARNKALLEANIVTEIANCYPTALYFQENKLTDEQWYYFRVDFPSDLAPVKRAFTPAQVTSASEFKKRMASAPGASYTGTAGQLDALFKRWSRGIKIVETIDFIGYSKNHGAWVFNELAVKDGKSIKLNDEDYFDIGRLSIKSLSQSPVLKINPDLKDLDKRWLELLWECYHHKGIVALAFWLGALFAEQIREAQESYPFIELVGDPGAGKSTLIEFMWRLVGRTDYEGFDPVKSTMAARARNFTQVSNLPVVLMEGDRKGEDDKIKQKGFDWDELRPLYNGRSVYSRGVKNGGNDTYEPPFRGALVISQNASVAAAPATMERICHVHFDKASHTPETMAAARALTAIDVENLSGFALVATMAEKSILGIVAERFPVHEKRLLGLSGIRTQRIAKTHAQLSSLVDALGSVVSLSKAQRETTLAFIEDMALERQEAINADHAVVSAMWEIYEFLNGDQTLNHSRGTDTIAISLNHFVKVATEARQQVPDLGELKKLLRTSRERKFIDYKPVNSVLNEQYNKSKQHPDAPDRPATVKCWVFQAATTPVAK